MYSRNYLDVNEKVYNKILHERIEDIDVVALFENYIKGKVNISEDVSIEEQVMTILLNENLDFFRKGGAKRAIASLCLMTVAFSLNPTKGNATPNQIDNMIVHVAGGGSDATSAGDSTTPDDPSFYTEVNPETGEDEPIPEIDVETGEEIKNLKLEPSEDSEDGFLLVNAVTGEEVPENISDIPEETSNKMLNGIRSAMLKLQREAEGVDMPDFSPDNEALKEILDNMYDLEEMFIKTSKNLFMYSMLVTAVMNASKGVSAGRSSTTNSIYLKNRDQREEMFFKHTIGASDSDIAEYMKSNDMKNNEKSLAISELIEKAIANDQGLNELWEIFEKIESDTLLPTSSERGFSSGAIWMWAPKNANKTDLSKSISPEQAKKYKEHFCGGTQNYLLRVLKDKYGELEVPDNAFNSTLKWHASPEVQKTLVFDYRSFVGVPSDIISNVMGNVITKGMIIVIKTAASFNAKVEGGHFGFVVKVVRPKKLSPEDFDKLSPSGKKEAQGYVVSFEGNTSDSRAPRGQTGFRLVKRPFKKIASAAAIVPIFSKATRAKINKLMKMSRDLRGKYTEEAIKKWLHKKYEHRKQLRLAKKKLKNKRKIAKKSKKSNRRRG